MIYDNYNPDVFYTSLDIEKKLNGKLSVRQIQRILQEMEKENIAWRIIGRYITTEKNWNNYNKMEYQIGLEGS